MKNWKRAWREKCNPGSRYRKRLEPVFPGRLDLRSRRDVITEEEGKSADRRTERRKKRRKKKGNKKTKRRGQSKSKFWMSCYSPSHPSPVPEQRSCSQEDQQQQHQHCNQYGDCACTQRIKNKQPHQTKLKKPLLSTSQWKSWLTSAWTWSITTGHRLTAMPFPARWTSTHEHRHQYKMTQ